jgi:hypothetical protein
VRVTANKVRGDGAQYGWYLDGVAVACEQRGNETAASHRMNERDTQQNQCEHFMAIYDAQISGGSEDREGWAHALTVGTLLERPVCEGAADGLTSSSTVGGKRRSRVVTNINRSLLRLFTRHKPLFTHDEITDMHLQPQKSHGLQRVIMRKPKICETALPIGCSGRGSPGKDFVSKSFNT